MNVHTSMFWAWASLRIGPGGAGLGRSMIWASYGFEFVICVFKSLKNIFL